MNLGTCIAIVLALTGTPSASALTSVAQYQPGAVTYAVDFPYEAIFEDHLLCYDCDSGWAIRRSVYRISAEHFTAGNIEQFFRTIMKPTASTHERQVVVLSDPEETKWFTEDQAFGFTSSIEEFRAAMSRFAERRHGVASCYAIGPDVVAWVMLPGQEAAPRRRVLFGRDPFDETVLGIPFSVVGMGILPSFEDGVRCLERTVSFLARPCDFTEDRIRQLVKWVADRFPSPQRFIVDVDDSEAKAREIAVLGLDTYSLYLCRLTVPGQMPDCPSVSLNASTSRRAHCLSTGASATCRIFVGPSETSHTEFKVQLRRPQATRPRK